MLHFINDATWLTITNLSLGAVVLIAAVVVGYVFAGELYAKLHKKLVMHRGSAHELYVPDLGLTMADGGEKIQENIDNLKDYHL